MLLKKEHFKSKNELGKKRRPRHMARLSHPAVSCRLNHGGYGDRPCRAEMSFPHRASLITDSQDCERNKMVFTPLTLGVTCCTANITWNSEFLPVTFIVIIMIN